MRIIEWILTWLKGRRPTTENRLEIPYRQPGVVDNFEPAPEKPVVKRKPIIMPFLSKTVGFFMQHFWNFVGAIALFSAMIFIGWLTVDCKNQPPTHTDHCYISYSKDADKGLSYQLVAYRTNHDHNIIMGAFETFAQAVDAAKLIECPIK